MKRVVAVISVMMVIGLLVAVQVGNAAEDIASTKHNLSASNGSTSAGNYGTLVDYGEICVYCHTPHNKNASATAPLWNRGLTDTSGNPYTMYSNADTIDMTIDAQPTGVSLACLSCHDGSIGIDVIVNQPGDGGTIPGGDTMRLLSDMSYNPNLSQDLSDDHPVSVTYDVTADTKFNAATGTPAKIGGLLPLYGGKVQCASCHNPHEADNGKFLRLANSGSALCLTCHIK